MRKRRKKKKKNTKYIIRPGLLTVAIFIILTAGISLGLLEFYQYLNKSSYLRIKKIKIKGIDQDLKKDIVNLCNLKNNKMNFIFLNSNDIKQKIEMHPWVRLAKIEKKFPDTLVINIHKEIPYALVIINDDIFYVDSYGNMFKRVRYGEDIDLPIITGLDNNSSNFKNRLKKSIEILHIIKDMNYDLSDISEIHIGKYGNTRLYFCHMKIEVLLSYNIERLNKNSIIKKLERLKKILKYFSNYGQITNILFIDLDCVNKGAIVSLIK